MSTSGKVEPDLSGDTLAKSPFDDPNADVILRSSDNVDFYVFKFLLSLMSPVFRDMFILPQTFEAHSPSGDCDADWRDGKPIVRVSEDSHIIETLLRYCDPRCKPVIENLGDVQLVLDAADKYDMLAVEKCIEEVLKAPQFVEQEPVRVFAIACRYKLEEATRLAARHTLRQTLIERPYVPELQFITASALQRLHEYYFRCGHAAHAVATDFKWIKRRNFVWFECSGCIRRATPHGYCQAWWLDYMELAAKALMDRPCGSTIMDPEISRAPMHAANLCLHCRDRAFIDIQEFNKLFAARIEKMVATVSAPDHAR